MKSINIIRQLSYLFMTCLMLGGCDDKIEYDPCLETKWLNPKEYEIKLAVRVSDNNPSLPGGSPGSQNPVDFQKMKVCGNIEKIECDGSSTGPVNLGNTYLDKQIDYPAPVNESDAYWIGHVV
ncbi:MAG: hypothetical protein U9N72_00310, partial [Bacteroidota bacterium]|nr:hypothetical protein [Bacteroidota bacterium]